MKFLLDFYLDFNTVHTERSEVSQFRAVAGQVCGLGFFTSFRSGVLLRACPKNDKVRALYHTEHSEVSQFCR